MKIKVCGMKYKENIEEVAMLPIDYIGFIFYPASPRYVDDMSPEALSAIPSSVKKTGVFVNEIPENIFFQANRYALDAVQLHGNESPETCRIIREAGLKVIKAFGLKEEKDLRATEKYNSCCDFFLFDTKASSYGGTGTQFNWSILEHYQEKIPFFLSGGISSESVRSIQSFIHPLLYGLDLNSCFEYAPGRKNAGLLSDFICQLKIENYE